MNLVAEVDLKSTAKPSIKNKILFCVSETAKYKTKLAQGSHPDAVLFWFSVVLKKSNVLNSISEV